jgi:hypothetical protein
LLWREVLLESIVLGAAVVMDAIGSILPDVNLAVWVRDFVNDIHD